MYIPSVSNTREFQRIKNLPRRNWQDLPLEKIKQKIYDNFRLPGSNYTLYDIQAAALFELTQYRGAFLPVSVGGGKSLISLLAPQLLGATRPILIVPAQLRNQTKDYVIPELERHWTLHPNLKIIGYSELSLAKNATLLQVLKPDLIILDEAHKLKDRKSGRTKRLLRYLKKHPHTQMVAMSGTISRKSIKDFAHIIAPCLKMRTPLPFGYHELNAWAGALDHGLRPEEITNPGALLELCKPGENVREGFGRRLRETPGVVASSPEELGTSLLIKKYEIKGDISIIKKTIIETQSTWSLPNSDIIIEAVSLWRHLRELSLGFYYKFNPLPPKNWMEARKAWRSFCQKKITYGRSNLDTELMVKNDCERTKDKLSANHPYFVWLNIKDTFKLSTVPAWFDNTILNNCKEWLDNNKNGICWVESTAFGEKLAEQTGYAYYGAGANSILNCKGEPIIASIKAHSEGKNLQHHYHKNLIASVPPSGAVFEQLMGRTHRKGQTEDEVIVDVLLHTESLLQAFKKALESKDYLEDSYSHQRLSYANILI